MWKKNRFCYVVIITNLLLFSCTRKVEEIQFNEDRVGSDYYKHEVWGLSDGKWKQLFSLNLDLSSDSVFIARDSKTDVAVRTVLTDDTYKLGLSVEYASTNGSKSVPQLKSKLVKQKEIKEFCEDKFLKNWQKYSSGNNVIIIDKSTIDSTYSAKKPFFMKESSRSWILDLFDNGNSSSYVHYFELTTSGKRQRVMIRR